MLSMRVWFGSSPEVVDDLIVSRNVAYSPYSRPVSAIALKVTGPAEGVVPSDANVQSKSAHGITVDMFVTPSTMFVTS